MNADACEPQEALPARSGGETDGAQARWSETGDRHAGTDADPVTANDRWSLDFVSVKLTDGRRFRVLRPLNGLSLPLTVIFSRDLAPLK